MDVKLITKEKNMVEVEVDGADISLLNALVEKLTNAKGVEMAAYKLDHPVVGKPVLMVKTKGASDASSVLAKALDELESETEEFKKKFSGMLK